MGYKLSDLLPANLPLGGGELVLITQGDNSRKVSVADLLPGFDGETLRSSLSGKGSDEGAGIVAFSSESSYPAESVGAALRGTIKPVIKYDWSGTDGTDNSIYLQDAIDSTAKTVGVVNRGAIEFLSGGEFVVKNQIEIEQKALLLIGNQVLVKWLGSNAKAMFHVVDSSRCKFESMVLIGDISSPPTAAIYFEAKAPLATVGTNENHLVDGLIIGRRYGADTTTGGSSDATPKGRFQNGIVIGGALDGNNDEYTIRNTQIHSCVDAGVDFRNGQGVWSGLDTVLANDCNIGFRLGCNMNVSRATANRNKIADFEGVRNIEVWIDGFEAENSQLFTWSKGGASFFVRNGKLLMNKSTPGNYFRNESGGALSLENIAVVNNGSVQQTIFYRDGSVKKGIVKVSGCNIAGGDLRDTYDIDTGGSGGAQTTIDIQHGVFVFRTAKPYLDRQVTMPLVAAGASGLVGSGSANTPFGEFFNLAYQFGSQGQHLVVATDAATQIRARIFNVTAAAITLAAGRLRWMNLGDQVMAVGSENIDVPLMVNNSGYTATVKVPGVRLGDYVAWSAGSNYMNSVVTAYVSAEDVVSLRIHNASGGSSDPASTVLYAARIKEFGSFHGGANYTPSAIANGSSVSITCSVPGAQLGGHTFVAYTKDLQGLICTAHVSAIGVVTIVISNYTGAPVTLAAGSFKAMVAF